jgi:hypothetical protein
MTTRVTIAAPRVFRGLFIMSEPNFLSVGFRAWISILLDASETLYSRIPIYESHGISGRETGTRRK